MSLLAATGDVPASERYARNRFVRILDQVRSRHTFALIGYVVMPEHVHLLIGEPYKGNPSKALQVWSEKKLREKLVYMHANPVRRKLVTQPKDWPWSSWPHYAKGDCGLIAIDSLEMRSTPEKIRTLKPEGCGTQTRAHG